MIISTRLAPEIFSLKDQHTFRFPNFLIIGLRNSSANCCFGIISLLTAQPEVISPETSLSKTKKDIPIKRVDVDIHRILKFWQY